MTLALPPTTLPGAFSLATLGTSAASGCSSPSITRCGYFSLAIFVASTTLSTSGCLALPLVEWESMAITGFGPIRDLKLREEVSAMAASSSGVGSWFRPQSANRNVPFSPKFFIWVSIIKKADTNFTPGAVFNICSAGRRVSAVEWQAPATMPSASLFFTITIPKVR